MGWFVLQTVMGAVGSLGFAVVFGIRDWKLGPITVGGAFGWVVYLFCVNGMGTDMFTGLFVASLATTLLSEILARIIRTPVLLLLVPMLIPQIPGGDLYYMMDYFVRKDYAEFGPAARKVLAEAGAIALGIIVGAYVAVFTIELQRKIKAKRS